MRVSLCTRKTLNLLRICSVALRLAQQEAMVIQVYLAIDGLYFDGRLRCGWGETGLHVNK